MNAHAACRLIFASAILALLSSHASALSDVEKGKSNLVRFDPDAPLALAPDADAKGTFKIDTKTSTGRDRMTVCVKKVDNSQTYDLYMEDPEDLGGALVNVGTLVRSGSSQKLKIDTDKGDTLPFGETSFDNLIGLQVEVRVGSVVYLSCVVPAFGGDKKTLRAKQDLGLAPGTPDSNGEGEFDISSKASSDDQRIRVKVKAIDFDSHTFFLWIERDADEDPKTPDTFEVAGVFTRKNSNSGDFERRTSDGAPLPFGDLSAADFSGRVMEVRDQNDVAYLSGLIPQLD